MNDKLADTQNSFYSGDLFSLQNDTSGLPASHFKQ